MRHTALQIITVELLKKNDGVIIFIEPDLKANFENVKLTKSNVILTDIKFQKNILNLE